MAEPIELRGEELNLPPLQKVELRLEHIDRKITHLLESLASIGGAVGSAVLQNIVSEEDAIEYAFALNYVAGIKAEAEEIGQLVGGLLRGPGVKNAIP